MANGVAMHSLNGQKAPGTPQQIELAQEKLALSPERVLLTALDAPDAHAEPDTVLQSVPRCGGEK